MGVERKIPFGGVGGRGAVELCVVVTQHVSLFLGASVGEPSGALLASFYTQAGNNPYLLFYDLRNFKTR